MGVVTARLVFLAFLGLTGSIIYNALYLQDLPGTTVVKAGARPVAAPVEMAKLPPVSTDLPPLEVEVEGAPRLLVRAVQRELAERGFDVGAEDGRLSGKTKAAISAYQKGHDLPVTGVASDELLRHILLGDRAQPGGATGSVRDASKMGAKQVRDVKTVQQILADLGYAPGSIDGAAGEATKRAISSFQRDRKIAETGKITPELLAELKRVTGEDLPKMAAER
jgi:peptidoglycan hydrolase-like protein with peptidoglycan-binding domain